MSEIQRYDVVFRIDDAGEGYRHVKDVDGAYVLFTDHQRELDRLRAGFPNIDDMRQAMIDTADENVRLRNLLMDYRESEGKHRFCSDDPDGDDRCDLCKRTDAELHT
jgi:hypothetical protein